MQDVDAAGVGGSQLIRKLAGAVRRVVVHDNQVIARALREHALDQRGQVGPRVAGRDHDDDGRRG